jgi:hypothetical protein
MFEHDPEQILDRQLVSEQGDAYRERMLSISTPEIYLSLPPDQHWNEAACILIKANANIASKGIDFRARHEIPSDGETAFVPGQNISNQGTVTDVKAGFYNSQSEATDQIGFGSDPSILVYARERAPGARGKGTVGSWHLKGWMAFKQANVIDYNSQITEMVDDRFGQPYVTLFQQGLEAPLSINDPRAKDIKLAVDEVAMACLNIRLNNSRNLGQQVLLRILPEQLAS